MARLLYVEGSPRKSRSVSIFAAKAFLDAYQAANSNDVIDVLDVWSEDLPQLDQDAFEAKYAGLAGVERTPDQQAAWDRLDRLAQRFRSADKIVIGVPMWNFAIPYRLKQLIDLVSHKDLLFTFDERGLNGLLTNSKALVIYARGISYGEDSGMPLEVWDQQKPYMDLWLNFIGVLNVQSMIVEKTLFEEDRDAITKQASALAQGF
ncbi:MAG: NAD(P)H-dependent oxidoreductase [Hyphomicrobiaceae bacterium]